MRVHAAHGRPGWQPVQAIHKNVEPEKVWRWYHAADAGVVSSLHDGMNLVSKEYVAAGRDDGVEGAEGGGRQPAAAMAEPGVAGAVKRLVEPGLARDVAHQHEQRHERCDDQRHAGRDQRVD